MTSERLFVRLDRDPPRAPETCAPAHTLREYAVSEHLRGVVANVLVYEERFADGACVTERVLPDGASRIIVGFERGMVSVHVAGAQVTPVVLTMQGHMHGLSVTLEPGATQALFGVAANALTEQAVSWDRLVAPAYRDLAEQMAGNAGEVARVEVLGKTLSAMLHERETRAREAGATIASPALTRAVRRLRSDHHASVRSVAGELGLSERRLQQLFAAQIGISPGAWRRLQRLHAALRLLRDADSPRWSDLALDAGYYDQAHLINEFRAHCGLTPQQFLQRRISHSSNTHAGPLR